MHYSGTLIWAITWFFLLPERCCHIIWSLIHPLPLAHLLRKQTNVEILCIWISFYLLREEILLCLAVDHHQLGAHPSAVLLTLSPVHLISGQEIAASLKPSPALWAACPASVCALWHR